MKLIARLYDAQMPPSLPYKDTLFKFYLVKNFFVISAMCWTQALVVIGVFGCFRASSHLLAVLLSLWLHESWRPPAMDQSSSFIQLVKNRDSLSVLASIAYLALIRARNR
jgi:hypothetical protein